MLVVIVSWFQAIAWLPLNVAPGSRLDRDRCRAGTWVCAAVDHRPRSDPSACDLVVAGVLLAYLLAAYALALAAVRAERRGDSWRLWFSSASSRGGASPRQDADAIVRGPFARPRRRSSGMNGAVMVWACLFSSASRCLVIWGVVLSTRRPIDAALLPLILGLLLLAPVSWSVPWDR